MCLALALILQHCLVPSFLPHQTTYVVGDTVAVDLYVTPLDNQPLELGCTVDYPQIDNSAARVAVDWWVWQPGVPQGWMTFQPYSCTIPDGWDYDFRISFPNSYAWNQNLADDNFLLVLDNTTAWNSPDPHCCREWIPAEGMSIATMRWTAVTAGPVTIQSPYFSASRMEEEGNEEYCGEWAASCGEPASIVITILDTGIQIPGDCNHDGGVDFADINPFLVAYYGGLLCADINSDGVVTLADVNPFIELLYE